MTKPQKIIIIILAVLLAGLLAAAAVIFATRQLPEPVVNAFVPPQFDAAAQTGIPDALDESLSYGTLELTPTAIVSMCANVNVENNAAQVYLTNHEGNQGWIKIKLLDEDGALLGQSGLLRPGQYVQWVELSAVPQKDGLVAAKILIYEPDTYLSLGSASAQVMLLAQ